MRPIFRWFKRQFHTFDYLLEYFDAVRLHFLDVIWGIGVGAAVPYMIFGLYSIFKTPPPMANWIAIVGALFLAGYYLWRADHIRLIPQFELKEYGTHSADNFAGGRKIGWNKYYQLLPKCLTEANVEHCRGILKSIEMYDGLINDWKVVSDNPINLEWSYVDSAHSDEPITLYPGAERHLNIFYISSSSNDHQITPCVKPYPTTFWSLFNQLGLRKISVVKFNVEIFADKCPSIGLAMTVQPGNEPLNPIVEVKFI